MTKLSDNQIAQMRNLYDDIMSDTCDIHNRSNVLDAAGEPIPIWVPVATSVSCGFEFSPFKFRSRELVAGGEETSEILVRARLPISYYDIVDVDSRLILTARFGETYTTSEIYEVQGFEERGPAGLIVNLKRVQP